MTKQVKCEATTCEHYGKECFFLDIMVKSVGRDGCSYWRREKRKEKVNVSTIPERKPREKKPKENKPVKEKKFPKVKKNKKASLADSSWIE